MGVTKSTSQNISSPDGNSLAVFIDGVSNLLMVKDIYGVSQSFSEITDFIEVVQSADGSGIVVLREGDTVTLNTDGAVLQKKDEKGVADGYASLDAQGKLPVAQLPTSVLTYEGVWNASTNTPTLADGTGDDGDFYIVSVAGTQNLGSGDIDFELGDWVIYNGATWQRNPAATETLQTVTDRGNTTTNGITTASTTSDFFELNTSASHTLAAAQAAWNDSQGTWSIGMQIDSNMVENDLGLNTFYPVCRNTDSVGDLPKGTLVMVDPATIATGDRLNVVRAVTDGTYSAQLIVGIMAEDFAANDVGYVQWFGQIKNIPASNINLNGETWSEGQILYADPINAGGLTNVEQVAPNKKSTIAVITALNGQNVSLLVRPWLGQNISELNDVTLTAVADNNILQYNSATQVWENVEGTTTSIAEGLNLYFTQARARQSVSGTDGIGYTEATGVFTNTDKGSSQNIIKTIDGDSGTITADSNTDAIQIIGGTNVTTDISGKTLTINSTDQFGGTVTSVNLTAGTDITVSGGPITSSGSIAVNHADTSTLSGTYGSTLNNAKIDTITVDERGHVTAVTVGVTGDIESVTAGDGLSGGGTTGPITLTNADKGSSQNIIKTIDGDSGTITADSNDYGIQIIGGTNVATTISANALVVNIDDEVNARAAADNTLQSNIDAEEASRVSADSTLQSNIDSANTARLNGDNALQSNIDAEETARISADTNLQSNIDAEETARISADTNLQSNIDLEVNTRAAADTNLQSNIDAEESARIAADNQLQSSKQSTSQKNQGNGYAGLDSSGRILQSAIPSTVQTGFVNTSGLFVSGTTQLFGAVTSNTSIISPKVNSTLFSTNLVIFGNNTVNFYNFGSGAKAGTFVVYCNDTANSMAVFDFTITNGLGYLRQEAGFLSNFQVVFQTFTSQLQIRSINNQFFNNTFTISILNIR